jgi:hypothetical protein
MQIVRENGGEKSVTISYGRKTDQVDGGIIARGLFSRAVDVLTDIVSSWKRVVGMPVGGG